MAAVTLMQRLLERSRQYSLLMRFDRPVGILLLLWPTLWALWIAAEGVPNLWVLMVFMLGVILMRAAGCVINDVADRKFDPHVARTRNRPIAAGRVSVNEALILFMLLCLLAFMLVLTLNRLTILLAFGAVFLAATYPFIKRYTHLPQIYLGMAFGWSVPMAFAAQTGVVPVVAWLLYTATILWATVYDTMYAMVDREDDIKIGVKSTAILFAGADRVMIAVLQALFLLVLWIVGQQLSLTFFYYAGLMLAAAFFVYQQYLIRHREPVQCMRAFLNNKWLGLVIYTGLVLSYYA